MNIKLIWYWYTGKQKNHKKVRVLYEQRYSEHEHAGAKLFKNETVENDEFVINEEAVNTLK